MYNSTFTGSSIEVFYPIWSFQNKLVTLKNACLLGSWCVEYGLWVQCHTVTMSQRRCLCISLCSTYRPFLLVPLTNASHPTSTPAGLQWSCIELLPEVTLYNWMRVIPLALNKVSPVIFGFTKVLKERRKAECSTVICSFLGLNSE